MLDNILHDKRLMIYFIKNVIVKSD